MYTLIQVIGYIFLTVAWLVYLSGVLGAIYLFVMGLYGAATDSVSFGLMLIGGSVVASIASNLASGLLTIIGSAITDWAAFQKKISGVS